MPTDKKKLLFRIRCLILFFIIALLISGITAFPLRWELNILCQWFGSEPFFGEHIPGLAAWLQFVREGIEYNAVHYPFYAYGADWLAFAHIVIAISFLGPLYNPVRNIWTIHFGMIACVLILPLAFICGEIRHIPLGWQLVDCSFGVFGIIPLLIIHRWTKKLEKMS
ncbi:MAG: hypothetical protein LBF88_13635 [Planctomycetaceae bacterium]|jgi:hypothetical protein|nr:hypothetical protein [Planctomycetaceae bacterium]